MYDAIVVGGGPAGLAAATWLGRYRRRTLVLDAGEPRNRWVDDVHGYLGADPIAPDELLARGRAHVNAYDDVDLRQARVAALEPLDDGFRVTTAEDSWDARRVVLATGVTDVFPDVAGFFTHYGADVFHCPTCDGFEARGRRVVAFGWSAATAGFALELLDWARDVTVVTNGQTFEGGAAHQGALARHDVEVVEDEAAELLGPRGGLEGVRLRTGRRLPCEVAFFSIDHQPVTALACHVGCDLDGDGHVVVDEHGESSVSGVYAAGDLVPGLQLVQVAAAEGAVAGTHCALSLRNEPSPPDGAPHGPDVAEELARERRR